MTIAKLPLTPSNLAFILAVGVNRFRIRYSANTHPFDAKFLSGDAFRSLADHVYDGQNSFDPTKVGNKDIVFVTASLIDAYFRQIHPKISHRYILITHNGDTNIDIKRAAYADAKIIAWFAQNVLVKHRKIHPIPIGLENMSYWNHGIPSLFTRAQTKKKQSRILFGFSLSTNQKVRGPVEKLLVKTTVADAVLARLNAKEYLQLLDRYQFVASPPGNGEDCIRTWEALYRGVIPIVQKSVAMETFTGLGLPIWMIDEWSDLQKYSEHDLRRKYQLLFNKSKMESLRFEYWKKKVHAYVR